MFALKLVNRQISDSLYKILFNNSLQIQVIQADKCKHLELNAYGTTMNEFDNHVKDIT